MDHLSKVKPILPNSPVSNFPKCPEYTRREYPGRVLLKLNLTGSFFFSAFNIKCPVCTNIPHMGARKCDSYYVESKTCPMGLDKCMTVTGQMKDVVGAGVNFPTKFVVKNCSNSLLCEGGSDLNSKKRTTV